VIWDDIKKQPFETSTIKACLKE
jgi:hypothetical protein